MANGSGVLTSPTLLRKLADPDKEIREGAWRAFLQQYRPMIFSWCRRHGLNQADAEEAVAVVLSRLVEAMTAFAYDPTRRFRSWLKTVVHNEVRCLWRRRQRRPGELGSGDPLVHQKLEEFQDPDAVDDLIDQLDGTLRRDLQMAQQVVTHVRARVEARTWQAYWLTEIDGEEPSEVARKLGMKVSALYVAKSRVFKLLRQERDNLTCQT
jgi:RNA polymerase sigma-70 factor (ECF subfamily)